MLNFIYRNKIQYSLTPFSFSVLVWGNGNCYDFPRIDLGLNIFAKNKTDKNT